MKLLLLSNSTNYGESYMDWCAEKIGAFTEGYKNNIVFISYAAVGFSYDEYCNRVNTALSKYGVVVTDINTAENPKELIKDASAIFVGGGNTFQLLKLLQEKDLLKVIKDKVAEGIPYVGWSAGSNIAGPSIKTTNDMPIVEPNSFEALNFIPYQINPHYTEKTIPDHGGETRMQRLQEFISANPESEVVCLPEACYLEMAEEQLKYIGSSKGFLLNTLGIQDLKSGFSLKLF